AWEEPLEDRLRTGLELVSGTRARAVLVDPALLLLAAQGLDVEGHQRPHDDLLEAHRDEPGVDDLHQVDLAGQEGTSDGPGDDARVLVRGLVAEPGERRRRRVVAEPEVALALAAHHVQDGLAPQLSVLLDLPLGGAQDRRVVRTAQAPVGGDHDVRHTSRLGPGNEERALDSAAGVGDVVDNLGDLLAVRDRRLDPRLRAYDAAGGDELHRPRDLLGGLDASNAPPEGSLLTARHPLPRPFVHSVASVFSDSGSGTGSPSSASIVASDASDGWNIDLNSSTASLRRASSGICPVSRISASRSEWRVRT